MMNTTPKIGFVGLGNQGAPIAERILNAGYPLSVWARRMASTALLSGAGAKVAGSVEDLARLSDILCVCVLDDAGVVDVASRAMPQMAQGSMIIILSTAHPQTCRNLAEQA